MPKRTNLFQRVVRLLHENVAGEAAIEESAMLEDRAAETLREVDVVIRSRYAGHPIVLAIEATQSGRKATLTWVDGMLGKHASIATDKLVLVSETGFSAPARRKAEAMKAVALSPDDLEDTETEGKIVNKLGAIYLKIMTLDIEDVAVTLGTDDDQVEWPATAGTPLFYEDGEFLATVVDTLRWEFNQKFSEISKAVNLADALDGEKQTLNFATEGELLTYRTVDGVKSPAGAACAQLDASAEEGSEVLMHYYVAVRGINAKCVVEIEVAEIPLAHKKVEGLSGGFAFGEGKLGDRTATFFVDESGPEPNGKLILDTPEGPVESVINPFNDEES